MHIEQASEIDYASISHAQSIAITAGASTPNWIINDTCSRVEQAFREKRPRLKKVMAVLDVLMKTNMILAAGAGCLTLGTAMISPRTKSGCTRGHCHVLYPVHADHEQHDDHRVRHLQQTGPGRPL